MSGRDSKLGASSLLVSPNSVLSEASAYRITPTFVYVYKYKDNVKSKGIVPVRIKHANVAQYWDDIVDPEPGDPLNNLVIGTLPKSYNDASDLKPKDPKKKVKDLMTPDGPAGAKAAADKGVPEKDLAPTLLVTGDALNVAVALGYKPDSEQAAMLGTLADNEGNLALAAETYLVEAGQKKLKKSLEAVTATMTGLIVEAAEHEPPLVDVDEDPDVADNYIATFLKTAPEYKPPKKPGTVAAPPPPAPPPPTPALSPMEQTVADFKKGIQNAKPSHVAATVAPGLSLAPGVASTLGFALVTGVDQPYIGTVDKQAMVDAFAQAKAEYASAGGLGPLKNEIASALAQGVTQGEVQTQLTQVGISANQAFMLATAVLDTVKELYKQKVAEKAPAPAPAPTPAPTPTASGTGSAFFGGLSIPPLETLTVAGDAKATLGGAHPKKFLVDGQGNKYLFKSESEKAAQAGAMYATLAAKVLGPDKVVPVAVGWVPGAGFGSVQPIIPNIQSTLADIPLTKLSPVQLDTLLGERVMDWALSSHDAKPGNFLMVSGGKIVGIDKEQALKNIGSDKLDTSYNPNPTKQLYSTLFDLYAQKKINLNVEGMLKHIKAVEAISDDEWLAQTEGYIGETGLTAAGKAELRKKILARKKNLRAQFEEFVGNLKKQRGELGFDEVYTFPEEKPEKKDTAPSGPAVIAGVTIPPLSSLTPLGKASIGGGGDKYFFQDQTGKKWLLKVAATKGTEKKPQPARVAVQELFAKISDVVRPGKAQPVGNVPEGYNGFPATLQPWLDLDKTKPTLADTKPAALTDSEKKDVAEEHLLDWMLSQHDTHAANLVRKADGTIVSIDKEQGFKYFTGTFRYGDDTSKPGQLAPEDTKLTTDYHPNGPYGENEPFYNQFWKSFASGAMDFDPTVLKSAIERIESIPDSEYTKMLSSYVENSPRIKDNKELLAKFLDKAGKRKKNIRADFEEFITDLYRKKKKKQTGSFTFAGGWADDDAPAKPAPAPTAPPTAATPQKPAKKAAVAPIGNGALQAAVAEASYAKTKDAKRAIEAVISAVAPTSGAPTDPASNPVWKELVDKDANFEKAVKSFLDTPANLLLPKLRAEAAAAHPADKLLQNAAIQEALNRKNGAKRPLEKALTDLYKAKTGADGRFTFAKGWVEFGKKPPPIEKSKTTTAAEYMAANGLTVAGDFDNDTTKAAVRVSGANWQDVVKAFEKEMGVTAVGAPKVKQSKDGTPKVFIPYDKEALNSAKKVETWMEEQPAPEANAPSAPPKTPSYFPTHQPALPYRQTYEDLKNAANMTLGESGTSFPTDGLGVQNNEVNVKKAVDAKGEPFFIVSFKMRPDMWKTAKQGGDPSTYKFIKGKYDKNADAFQVAGREGNLVLSTRAVSEGDSVLHLASSGDYTVNSKGKAVISTTDWANFGLVQAEIKLNPGETIESKMKLLLDKMQPGLGDSLFRPTEAEDAEITRLTRVLWSTNPQVADELGPADFTVAKLRKKAEDLKVPAEYLEAQETEVAPGYKAWVVPGRHKRPEFQMPDGSPKVRFVFIGSNTAGTLLKNLTQGPGPLSQTTRLQQGIGVGSGKSENEDRQSGGAEQVMMRMMTAGEKAKRKGSSGGLREWEGYPSGKYKTIYGPDELDRLDTIHFSHDAFGALGGSYKQSSFLSRSTLSEAVNSEVNNPKSASETDFRRSVDGRRALRVVCDDTAARDEALAEAKKRGITDIHGVPVDDFFVVGTSMSGEDVYENYVKPMGF